MNVLNEAEMESKLKALGFSNFEINVLLEVYRIPMGETKTYSQIAETIGHRNASRAVGSAVRKNPFAPLIPCHRVVRKDGKIGNYSGGGGREQKRKMLKEEGIDVERLK